MEQGTAHHGLFCSDFWGWVLAHGFGGTLLTAAGLWWTGNVLSNFWAPSGCQPFRSQLTYPGPIRQLPLEGWCFLLVPGSLAILLAIGGVITSQLFGILHVVLFLGFVVFGVVTLLIHHKAPLPEGLDVATFVMAFYLKAFVTYTHLNGKMTPVAQAHSCLVLTDALVIFATLLERFCRDSVVCALARPYWVMVDGAWLIYIAVRFSGCAPASNDVGEAHTSLDVVVGFSWLHLVIATVILPLGWLIRRHKGGQRGCAYKQLDSEVA